MNTIFIVNKSFVYADITFPAKCIYIKICIFMQYLEI